MTNVDNNCCAVKLSFIERYRVSRKGIFFSIRLLFDPFTPVQSAKPMTRTDVKASPRIPPPPPASNLFYLKSDYINDRKTSMLYSYKLEHIKVIVSLENGLNRCSAI